MSSLTLEGLEKRKHAYRLQCFLLSIQELESRIQAHKKMLRALQPQEKQLKKIADLSLQEILDIEIKSLEWLTLLQELKGEMGIAYLQKIVQESQRGVIDIKTLTVFFEKILALFNTKRHKGAERRVSYAGIRK